MNAFHRLYGKKMFASCVAEQVRYFETRKYKYEPDLEYRGEKGIHWNFQTKS